MHLKLLLNRTCANALKRTYYTVGSRDPFKKSSVARQIQAKIKATGPITVADYMKEVLVNPLGGYYMHKNSLGADGDFITSPELSQIFGELIAVWFLNEWSKAGSPKPIQIVELGPGRGTLCNDILRVFQHFRILEHSTIHLVEASPLMGDSQSKLLCKESHAISDKNDVRYREGVSQNDVPISWYTHLKDVPHGFTLLVANEFFDALPVHKFVKTDRGYRELLVDLDPNDDQLFRFVTSPSETPVLKLFLRNGESREQFEASPQTLMMVKEIATRVEFDGGLALIADYGHGGEGTDTFRAFRKHQLHDPLIEPGTADITADVDFQALKEATTQGHEVLTYGPISQREFLLNMGIEFRLQELKKKANKTQIEGLQFSYDMLTNPAKMGERFKFFCMIPAVLRKIVDKHPVTGFHPVEYITGDESGQ